MKKNILAILISLFIPFSLISCTESSENGTNKEDKINNVSSANNSTSSEENNSNTTEKDTENNIEKDTEKEENTNIYYYDAISDKIVYINTTIKIKNDNATTPLIDKLKEAPNSDISPSLSSEVTLNSYNLDTNKSTITIDFSSNFVSAQNLGSGAESRTITAICNTFGSYFNVENVIITLDGLPYSSGHILMNEGEAFKVNLDNTVELK